LKRTLVGMLLPSLGSLGASTPLLANDLLGLYVGAAVGESHVRADQEILGDTDYVYDFDKQHFAWKVMAGIRPISPLGVELDYIDFGNPSGNSTAGFGGLSQADAKAEALFGLGYLPLPVPFLDVYGKLGIARSHMTVTEFPPVPSCPAGSTPCHANTFNISASSTNLAYGVGVQGKLGSLAIRAEYERISVSGGNPDILSVGVTWNF
jgi:opacity protein-like surface antigen